MAVIPQTTPDRTPRSFESQTTNALRVMGGLDFGLFVAEAAVLLLFDSAVPGTVL